MCIYGHQSVLRLYMSWVGLCDLVMSCLLSYSVFEDK